MSQYLLLLSIGPVQEFIAQARRMRDLWFGSHVLSEVSKAAARAMVKDGATLIFPALDTGNPRLEPCDELHHADGRPAYNVANKLLALVPSDPALVAEHAEAQAKRRLLEWGLTTLRSQGELVDPAAQDCAREQLETLLRVQAVWIRWSEDEQQDYENAREALEAELASRKTLHVFSPWKRQRGGVHKSSLDGGRETVLRKDGHQGKAWQRYRIGLREELDAVGLLKRAGGKPEQFVPVPSIGLAAWIEAAQDRQPNELAGLRKACKARKLTWVNRAEAWVKALPYYAQLLLPERWGPHLAEHGMSLEEATQFGREHVQPLFKRMREPYPYLACLVADGDRMGRAIDFLAKDGPERHRRFSSTLSKFAERARTIVERDHRGVLVYAGGDDVLGFVCVQDALACASALREAFAEVVHEAMGDALEQAPTLSVGIGIGHVLQSLGRLLALGRDAERHAKRADGGQRNTLAVIHERHSGALRTWHASWNDKPLEQIEDAVALLDSERLSAKKVYQVHALLRHAPADAQNDEKNWCVFLRSEVQRLLARTDLGGEDSEPLRPENVDLVLGDSLADARKHIERWTSRMQIAIELQRARHSLRKRA